MEWRTESCYLDSRDCIPRGDCACLVLVGSNTVIFRFPFVFLSMRKSEGGGKIVGGAKSSSG